MTLALEMWDWCQTIRDIFVIASHIPGGDNVSADKESRELKDMSEWKLDPTIIRPFLLNCQIVSESSNPDPGAIHTDAFTKNWAPLRGYASPTTPPPSPSHIDVQNPDESNNRPNETYSRCSSLASPALLAGSSETSNISAIVATDQSNPLYRPNRPEPSSSNVPSPSHGRVTFLYHRFHAKGIPTNVADLLIAATRFSTHKTYESSWNRWCRWHSGQNWSSFVINKWHSNFLTEVLNEGLSYRSLNVLRSAPFFQWVRILTLLTELFKGALNKRPPKPKYSHTWNVDVMIKYMISLGKNNTLSLSEVSHSVCINLSWTDFRLGIPGSQIL